MTVDDWLADACADADRRGIPELKPLLASLADATRTLRNTDWERVRSAAEAGAAGFPPPPATAPEGAPQ